MTRVCVITFTAFVDCHIYEANAEVGGSNPGQGQKSALVPLISLALSAFLFHSIDLATWNEVHIYKLRLDR